MNREFITLQRTLEAEKSINDDFIAGKSIQNALAPIKCNNIIAKDISKEQFSYIRVNLQREVALWTVYHSQMTKMG